MWLQEKSICWKCCLQPNKVLKSLNQKRYVGEIFCNCTQAFACVNHEILLAKLHIYGIQQMSGNWFRSYLTDRIQKAKKKLSDDAQDLSTVWGMKKFWRVESRTSWWETKKTQIKLDTVSNKNEQQQDAKSNAEIKTKWMKMTWTTLEETYRRPKQVS